jgi:hypothetical protein
MTRSANNTNTAYQRPQSYQQRRQLPPGRQQRQPMTDERSSTRNAQRGTNHSAPPAQHPITRRPQQWTDEEETDEGLGSYPLRLPSSVIPYRQDHTPQGYAPTDRRVARPSSPPTRRPVGQTAPEEAATAHATPRRRWKWHPLVFVGLGLFIMVIGYLLFGAVSAWWQGTLDGWQYGYPRTYQTDAVVGHHDSPANPSHFIAINLHSHIEVIEFPGGAVTHARVYLGPTLIGTGQDLAPVTLSFKDVNGDGKPDMIISVGGTIVVFINDGGQFRPLKPGEQVTL